MVAAANLKSDQNLLRYLRDFDVAIANHMAWLKRVNRVLICGEPPNPDDLLEDAHRRCKFGKWFHHELEDSLGKDSQYRKVNTMHQAMHDAARNILLMHRQRVQLTAAEYDAFSDRAADFKIEVRALQLGIINKVCLVDHLTGIWNRYAMFHNLAREYERLLRGGQPCCVALIDIDHFKQINDTYDHRTGDYVLQMFTLHLTGTLRKYDVAARYGGEEFLVCLPHTPLSRAHKVLDRVRRKLESTPIVIKSGESLVVTASFGVAEMTLEVMMEDIIERADHALLCAKAEGRNRVSVWGV